MKLENNAQGATSYLLINFELYEVIIAWDIESETFESYDLTDFRFSDVTRFLFFFLTLLVSR